MKVCTAVRHEQRQSGASRIRRGFRDDRRHARSKDRRGKPFGVAAAGARIEVRVFEAEHRVYQAVDRLFVEEKPGRAVHHGFQRATAAERNDRQARGLSLDRRNTKILKSRKEKRSA
jgi:hypothetical protein